MVVSFISEQILSKGGSVGFITNQRLTHEVKYRDDCRGFHCGADCVCKHLFQEILVSIKCAIHAGITPLLPF